MIGKQTLQELVQENRRSNICFYYLAYLLEVLADRMEYTMFLQLRGPPWSELSHLSQLPVRRKKNKIIWTLQFERVEIVQLYGLSIFKIYDPFGNTYISVV